MRNTRNGIRDLLYCLVLAEICFNGFLCRIPSPINGPPYDKYSERRRKILADYVQKGKTMVRTANEGKLTWFKASRSKNNSH